MLQKLAQEGKFPSPLIVEGPDSGLLCEKLVQSALCQTHRACGECPSCKKFTKGFHPDLLRTEGSLKIDELRVLLGQLHQKTFESSYRVLWINRFHEASVQIQNALLKTLEEPFSHWLIIMDVVSSHPLLPTIRSRCLLYKVENQKISVQLTETEDALYRHLRRAEYWEIYSLVEGFLKSRDSCSQLFKKLVQKASDESFPDHWEHLAPAFVQAIEELDRNLSPKTVWEKAWSQASNAAAQQENWDEESKLSP